MAAMSPLNRIGVPKEVAEVVAFLASDKASWIDGQIVQPNGGVSGSGTGCPPSSGASSGSRSTGFESVKTTRAPESSRKRAAAIPLRAAPTTRIVCPLKLTGFTLAHSRGLENCPALQCREFLKGTVPQERLSQGGHELSRTCATPCNSRQFPGTEVPGHFQPVPHRTPRHFRQPIPGIIRGFLHQSIQNPRTAFARSFPCGRRASP